MNPAISVFGRCLVAACAQAAKPRMVALAMAAAVAVAAPDGAMALEQNQDGSPVVQPGDYASADAPHNQAGKWLGGLVGAGAGAAIAAASGANKYFTAAAGVLGGIGGAKVGESLSTNSAAQARVGTVTMPADDGGEVQGLVGARGLERSSIFPSDVGRTDKARMSSDTIRSYDQLAVNAAAYRLLVQSSYGDYVGAKERLALAPRDLGASRQMLAAKRALEGDIAGLNVAIADFGNATNVLRQRYQGSNFGGYQALQVSIGAPASVQAREVEPDRPIYPAALALAEQIRSGQVDRVTAAAPGYATGGEMMRSALIRQDAAIGRSGLGSAAGPGETMRRLGMGNR